MEAAAILAGDVDVDQTTVKSWLSILETSGITYLLQPYYTNTTKRMVKTPELYFLDTGLCSDSTQWSSPETLETGAMSGAVFETWIFSELLKSYWHHAQQAYFCFYRDRDTKEVDLLIARDNTLSPIEIKKSASPSQSTSQSFSVLKRVDRAIGPDAVICLKESEASLSKEVTAVPIAFLLVLCPICTTMHNNARLLSEKCRKKYRPLRPSFRLPNSMA